MERDVSGERGESGLALALRSAWAAFRRRIWTFLAIVALVLAATAALILLLTPRYEAVARVKIDLSRSALTGVQEDGTGAPDQGVIETEASVFRSRELAAAVAGALHLENDPELAAAMPPVSGAKVTPQLMERWDVVGGNLLAALDVQREPSTYIIDVKIKSVDAAKAARVANSFVEQYIARSVGTRTGTAQRQAQWLQERLKSAAVEAQAAEAQAAQVRASAGIVKGGSGASAADQQVASLASQLATAESAAAAARSNLDVARSQIAAGGLDAVSSVLSSSVVADLRRQRAEVMRSLDEAQARYGPKHPETIRATQQLKSIDQQIDEEAKRTVAGLASDASAAAARAASLRSSLNQVRGEQSAITRASASTETLDRIAEAKRAAYERLAQSTQEVSQMARNSTSQAQIIEAAIPPDSPSSPNKKLLVGAGIALALLLASATITTQELVATGVRTIADIEERLGIPMIVAIPKLTSKQFAQTPGGPAGFIVERPMSSYAEAFRTTRSTLSLLSGKPPKVTAVVSTVPGEGKTTCALSLARIMALSGDRVLLIDCDLRRAGLRNVTTPGTNAGLIEVLRDDVDPSTAIGHDKVERLDILPVIEPVLIPTDFFSGGKMARLLELLGTRYDHIILDTPPLLGVADARSLSALADAVLLVIKWNDTPFQAVDNALSSLESDRSRVAGALLDMVDPSSETIGALYYSSKYSHYYAD